MGAAALPLVAAAVATGASYYNSTRTAKNQDRALAQGIREKAATQRKADQQIQQTLTDLSASSPADAIAQARQGYQQAVRGTQQQAAAGQALSGLSAAYDEAARNANATAAGSTANVADLLARMDAPLQQRRTEGYRIGNLGTDLDILERTAQGQDYLANLRAKSIRRNPWIDAFAAGLQGYASAAGGRGGGNSSAVNSTLGSGTGVNVLGNGAQFAGYA